MPASRKRQFAGAAADPAQRSITSFLAPGSSIPSSTPATSAPKSTPNLPGYIQSNLLNVGLRARKAVPEGYKTGGQFAKDACYKSPVAVHTDSDVVSTAQPQIMNVSSSSRVGIFSKSRELQPFCGGSIHNVGGLDTQQEHIHASEPRFTINDDDSMDGVPGLTMSQESCASTLSIDSVVTSAKTRKRVFEDEDETPEALAPSGLGNERVYAMPRKGGLRGRMNSTGTDLVGQENIMVVDDFEEAPFLDKHYEMDMDSI